MKRILLIGSPGSGKTTVLSELEKRGYVCFQEVSREIILEAQQRGIEQLFLSNPDEFNQKLLSGRIAQFEACTQHQEFVFIDRGLPDIIAYNNYINVPSEPKVIKASTELVYDFVFLFPAWKKIFKNDNERYESFEEALKIQDNLKDTYATYGYEICEVPIGDISERANYILNVVEYS
ncbi:MAG: AAA family ATPase [Flavobacteriaceae bacterium]